MKTQKINSIKVVTTAMLIITLLTITACGGNRADTANESATSSDSETSVKPPAMDIHTATLLGDLNVIKKHIRAGSDLNEKDDYGSSPLIIATTFGKTEVARALIEAGADVNCISNDGSTPLHTAAFLCRIEIVEALLQKGADKNVKNNYGNTALGSVTAPFDNVKGIYDQFSKDLGPLGLKLDYEHIKTARPKIADMLR